MQLPSMQKNQQHQSSRISLQVQQHLQSSKCHLQSHMPRNQQKLHRMYSTNCEEQNGSTPPKRQKTLHERRTIWFFCQVLHYKNPKRYHITLSDHSTFCYSYEVWSVMGRRSNWLYENLWNSTMYFVCQRKTWNSSILSQKQTTHDQLKQWNLWCMSPQTRVPQIQKTDKTLSTDDPTKVKDSKKNNGKPAFEASKQTNR